jgi:hypothetical protein
MFSIMKSATCEQARAEENGLPRPVRLSKASLLAAATLLLSSQLALAQFSQQGQKLVGTGTVGNAYQGISVALSADGKAAISGGPFDSSDIGAAWVDTRTGGVWQTKLIGTGVVGAQSFQG